MTNIGIMEGESLVNSLQPAVKDGGVHKMALISTIMVVVH